MMESKLKLHGATIYIQIILIDLMMNVVEESLIENQEIQLGGHGALPRLIKSTNMHPE